MINWKVIVLNVKQYFLNQGVRKLSSEWMNVAAFFMDRRSRFLQPLCLTLTFYSNILIDPYLADNPSSFAKTCEWSFQGHRACFGNSFSSYRCLS